MKAVGAKQFGGPQVLEVLELPVPDVGPGQVRIRVRAAAVNPTDTMLRGGAAISAWRQKEPPYVPGMDAAGTAERIGEGTQTDLRVGDRVMAVVVPVGSHGAYAEQIVVPADSVARSPANASDAEVATLPMNGLTARLALDDLRLRPGDTVAVTGAAGAVGGYVIELAKADGLRVIADAAPKDEALVRGLGADVVLPRGEDYPRRVRAEVPGGVDGAVDTALLERRLLPAVRDGGRIATLRRFEEEGERGVTFHPVVVSEHAREAGRLETLRRQAEEGLLTLRAAEVLPAGEAAEAHRRLEAGGVRGRLVLAF
ncbi:NADP-dependent oxidoreductase [Streptomyces sp. QL37]|uniref:NADP-dependent oxidoreductase n=1 Tax=Streptomyces sp. QL37 TaxID=2093747 RepID=UPI000CF2849B|nr:NADP-dependent oxidoreductase [Streptomyces sp. QL37]PPQ61436.1 alcohol dehydrogenase [Streptomyces sp. QL37]